MRMGAIDTEAKAYLSSPDKVADAFNYWVYGGRDVIKAEALEPMDTTAIALPYGNDAKKPIQKIRDVLKLYTAMKDEQAYYIMLGIEIQAETHYALPVRNMLYDAMSYAQQVSDIAAEHRKNKDKMTSGEFLSGLKRGDRLMPVITLVISLSTESWDGPLTLHEMLTVENKELLAFVPDYRLNLLSPDKIEDFGKFRTELGVLFECIKHKQDDNMGWMEGKEYFRHVNRNTASLIKTVTGFNISLDEEGDVVDMMNAWENGINQARNDGFIAGQADGESKGWDSAMVSNIKNLMETSGWDAQQTMDALKIPANEQEKYAKQL